MKTPDGKVESATTYFAECVVTPEQHKSGSEVRGLYPYVYLIRYHVERGYATRLLRSLHYILAADITWPAEWGEPPSVRMAFAAIGSCLGTRIDRSFYEHCYIGPGDQRPGWEFKDTSNTALKWTMRPIPLSSPNPTAWSHDFIRFDQLASVAPTVSRACRRDVDRIDTKGRSLVYFDPGSPGMLLHNDCASRLFVNPYSRKTYLPDAIVGVRLFPSNRASSEIEDVDPIVLFSPNCVDQEVLYVTLTVNLSTEIIPNLVETLIEAGKASSPVCDRLVAAAVDDRVDWVEVLVSAGAVVESRYTMTKPQAVWPLGAAWYGKEEEQVVWRGTEFWTVA